MSNSIWQNGHYRPRPDRYKHKKPKSRNPWSPNYEDSPAKEDTTLFTPQDYSQGYVNPYINTPDAPVFDTPSVQDNEATLRSFMDSNKPPHLQNRWKRQPEGFTFSQPIEKCGCEPRQEGFEYDINENANLPHSKGGLGFGGEDFVVKSEKKMPALKTPVWERKRPIWEKVVAEKMRSKLWQKPQQPERESHIINVYKELMDIIDKDIDPILNEIEELKKEYEMLKQTEGMDGNGTQKVLKSITQKEKKISPNRKLREELKLYSDEIELYLRQFRAKVGEDEYKFFDKLTFEGRDIMIYLYMSQTKEVGPKNADNKGPLGITEFAFKGRKDIEVIPFGSPRSFIEIQGMNIDYPISINSFAYHEKLYRSTKLDKVKLKNSSGEYPEGFRIIIGHLTGAETLANEFGDVKFAIEKPATVYYDQLKIKYYEDKKSKQFSEDYEKFFLGKNEKPKSDDAKYERNDNIYLYKPTYK